MVVIINVVWKFVTQLGVNVCKGLYEFLFFFL